MKNQDGDAEKVQGDRRRERLVSGRYAAEPICNVIGDSSATTLHTGGAVH